MTILKKSEIAFETRIPIRIHFVDIRKTVPAWHENSLRFIYVMDGRLSMFHDDRTYILKKGEFAMIDNDTFYFFDSDKKNSVILLDANLMDCGFNPEDIKSRYWYCNCVNLWKDMILPEAFQKMKNYIISTASLSYFKNDTFRKNAREICFRIIRLLNHDFLWFKRLDLSNEENKKYADRFQVLITYVTRHFSDKITLKTLADQISVEQTYLSRILSHTPYVSFTRMLNTIRCYMAEGMLLTTDMSVSEISNACGFSSEDYFRMQFADILDSTPSDFKKYMAKRSRMGEDFREMSHQDIAYLLNECIQNQYNRLVFYDLPSNSDASPVAGITIKNNIPKEILKSAQTDSRKQNILHTQKKH